MITKIVHIKHQCSEVLKMSYALIVLILIAGINCEESDNLVNCEGSLIFPPPFGYEAK